MGGGSLVEWKFGRIFFKLLGNFFVFQAQMTSLVLLARAYAPLSFKI